MNLTTQSTPEIWDLPIFSVEFRQFRQAKSELGQPSLSKKKHRKYYQSNLLTLCQNSAISFLHFRVLVSRFCDFIPHSCYACSRISRLVNSRFRCMWDVWNLIVDSIINSLECRLLRDFFSRKRVEWRRSRFHDIDRWSITRRRRWSHWRLPNEIHNRWFKWFFRSS